MHSSSSNMDSFPSTLEVKVAGVSIFCILPIEESGSRTGEANLGTSNMPGPPEISTSLWTSVIEVDLFSSTFCSRKILFAQERDNTLWVSTTVSTLWFLTTSLQDPLNMKFHCAFSGRGLHCSWFSMLRVVMLLVLVSLGACFFLWFLTYQICSKWTKKKWQQQTITRNHKNKKKERNNLC